MEEKQQHQPRASLTKSNTERANTSVGKVKEEKSHKEETNRRFASFFNGTDANNNDTAISTSAALNSATLALDQHLATDVSREAEDVDLRTTVTRRGSFVLQVPVFKTKDPSPEDERADTNDRQIPRGFLVLPIFKTEPGPDYVVFDTTFEATSGFSDPFENLPQLSGTPDTPRSNDSSIYTEAVFDAAKKSPNRVPALKKTIGDGKVQNRHQRSSKNTQVFRMDHTKRLPIQKSQKEEGNGTNQQLSPTPPPASQKPVAFNLQGLKAASKRKRTDEGSDHRASHLRISYNADGTKKIYLDAKNKTHKVSLSNKLPMKQLTERVTRAASTATSAAAHQKPLRLSRSVLSTSALQLPASSELSAICSLIQSIFKQQATGEDSKKTISMLRMQVQKAALCAFSNEDHINQSGILDKGGLREVFQAPEKEAFPWDLRSDAESLFSRLATGDIDGSLLRGVIFNRSILDNGRRHTDRSLDNSYRFRKSASTVGANGLFNGDWWESRISARRDGAHGEKEAGISGTNEAGAIAIVINSSKYEDEDNGEIVRYAGTLGANSIPSRGVRLLELTFANKGPLRVLRGTNSRSVFAPARGYRYDGLYTITAKEVLDVETCHYRFTLARNKGQDPIRYRGDAK